MTKKVFALDTKPGVQRDGTIFDKQFYSDGRWVRFQRGRPRKVGGYREIVADLSGPSRGIYVNPQNNFNYVFSGYRNGIQVLPIDNNGVGSGITNLTLSDFTPNANNLYQFDAFTDTLGGGDTLLLAHPGQNLSDINSSVNTPVLGGAVSGTTMSAIGVFTDSVTTVSGNSTVTLAAANILIGAGQSITGTGIPANTTVVSVSGTSVVLSANASASATITATFDNQIDVSGGVVVLHPYVFVYGNNGLLRNCSSGNLSDWVSADANAQNVATGKIVQGLPVRGGSNSPSGLFWSLDSLIRVSYNPTTINVGGTAITQFWRYDTITSQSSILSSQCVIEYDGIYYWCGVDRFMLYNGVVKEIPNTMNQNYFFDNLNYAQRQKVWATKVPRFGEVWWFYPRGDSVECNDAIVYNIRENCWYDAGTAIGARRSAGYFSQVFRFPISAGWEPNAVGGVATTTRTNAGSGYTNGTYAYLPVTGGSGSGATATVTVAGGIVTSFVIKDSGVNYLVGDTIAVSNATLGGGTGLVVTVNSINTFVSLWQHEVGTDAVRSTDNLAIESYFETNDLGWVSGGPAQPSAVGDNKWLHIERVEPDFVQSGTMECYVTGRPFAQSEDKTSEAYMFEPGTNKIDMREQRRELRLRFVSNVAGGDYQTGRIIISADTGDVRGY
jgi:hypothetical protein